MGDLPVLAAGAQEIASHTTQGQPAAARVVVIEGLDLDGRYPDGGDTAVNEGPKLAVPVLSRLAVSGLALSDFAAPLTDETLNAPFF